MSTQKPIRIEFSHIWQPDGAAVSGRAIAHLSLRLWWLHILYGLERRLKSWLLLGSCRSARLVCLGRLLLRASGQLLGWGCPLWAAQQGCSRWLLRCWDNLLPHLWHWTAIQI